MAVSTTMAKHSVLRQKSVCLRPPASGLRFYGCGYLIYLLGGHGD